jgi:antitoxin (DNA-binding transcriptional repressor) of toxin-antitoxin stability system
MRVSVTHAKVRLGDLPRRAEAGEEVVLTRRGRSIATLVAMQTGREARHAILDAIGRAGAAKATAGPDASRSQDFLYGGDGLPTRLESQAS